MKRSDVTNEAENFSMKGGYDRSGATLSQEAREEKELARVAGRQLGRSQAAPEDASPFESGLVAGKSGAKSDLVEGLARKSGSGNARGLQSSGRQSPSPGEISQLQSAPAELDGYAGGASTDGLAVQPGSPIPSAPSRPVRPRRPLSASLCGTTTLLPTRRRRTRPGCRRSWSLRMIMGPA